MAAVKERIFDYWSRWTPNFNSAASHVRHADAWRGVFAAAVPCPPVRRCLDLGTGTGACALALAAIGHRVTGLDGAAGMLDEARRAAAAQALAIDFVEGDVDRPAFADGTFDVVSARNLFWTLPDPDRTLGQIVRLLRPGGLFLFSDGLWRSDATPPAASSHDMTDYAELRHALPFYRGITPEEGEALLARHGFAGVRHWEDGFAVHPYAHQAAGACPFFVLTAERPEG